MRLMSIYENKPNQKSQFGSDSDSGLIGVKAPYVTLQTPDLVKVTEQ